MGLSMTDSSLGEALSAVTDGEAGEFELRRVLGASEFDQLRTRAFRYQVQSTLLHEERNAFASVDLVSGIHAAIEKEDAQISLNETPSTQDARFWQRSWVRSAVAASVTLAVILGVNTYNRSDLTASPMLAETTVSTPLVRSAAVASSHPVGAQSLLAGLQVSAPAATAVTQSPDRLAETNHRQALRLESYMRQHTAQTVLTSAQGALPFARVSSFDAP